MTRVEVRPLSAGWRDSMGKTMSALAARWWDGLGGREKCRRHARAGACWVMDEGRSLIDAPDAGDGQA
jgi:hypothetical protein